MCTLPHISVLCVDDNPLVADALKSLLGRTEGFKWLGWVSSADELTEAVRDKCPTVVLIDVDMPGRNPFEATQALLAACPDVKVVFFSGHVRQSLIERAMDAGAWGYASKNDGEEQLLSVVRRVAAGEVSFSKEAENLRS